MKKLPLETFHENILPSYPGYHVTKNGEVFSRRKKYGAKKLEMEDFWLEKSISYDKAGYPVTSMTPLNKKAKATKIHHLVALAYIGERPSGYYICHNDGNQKNNNLSNLRYDTPKSNSDDRELHGRSIKGERANSAVIKEANIPEIFRMACEGIMIKDIAKKFNVTPPTIGQILRRKKWKHIAIDEEVVKTAENFIGSGLSLGAKDVVNIFELRSKRWPKKHIAKKYGVSEKIIRDILSRKKMNFIQINADLIERAQNIDSFNEEEAIKLKKQGKTVAEIANFYNVCRNTVYRTFNKAGIKIR